MEGRTVGSTALYALDSDHTRHSPELATLLKAGAALATPRPDGARGAALAYIPRDPAGRLRGALFALAQSGPAEPDAQPGAAVALRYLADSFYSSLCHNAGRALDSAVDATSEYSRTLVWSGQRAGASALAVAVIQERQLWLATTGDCVAYVLRPPTGDWRVLDLATAPPTASGGPIAQRSEVTARPGVPITLDPGDLILLGSRALHERLSEGLIRNCLQTLVTTDPHIAEQSLADVLVRVAEGKPGAGQPVALVLRCHGVLPEQQALALGWPEAGRLALGRPNSFPWDFAALERQILAPPRRQTAGIAAATRLEPAAPPAAPRRDPTTRPIPIPAAPAAPAAPPALPIDLPAPPALAASRLTPVTAPIPVAEPLPDHSTRPIPVAAPGPDNTTRPIAVAAPGPDTITQPVGPAPAPDYTTQPIPAQPAPPTRPLLEQWSAVITPTVREWMDGGPSAWVAAEQRLARVLLPGVGVIAGAGLVGSMALGSSTPLLFGCSVSGLLFCSARLQGRALAGKLANSFAGLGGFGGFGGFALAGGSAAQAKQRLQGVTRAAQARPYQPPPRPAAAPPRQAAGGAITWGKERLLLPPIGAMKGGCLDIISLKDGGGRIVAQAVLLCPAHLLAVPGGHATGVYVLLHDLVTEQKRMVAWLAPGQRRSEAVDADVIEAGGNPAAVRWIRGEPEFELASSRLRVTLRLDHYGFVDAMRKQQLDSLEVAIVDVQAVL